MTKKLYPTDVVKQAQSVLDAWKQISATLTFGDLTSEMLSTDLAQAGPLENQITDLETQLTNLRNQRDDLFLGMWDKLKRVAPESKPITAMTRPSMKWWAARAERAQIARAKNCRCKGIKIDLTP